MAAVVYNRYGITLWDVLDVALRMKRDDEWYPEGTFGVGSREHFDLRLEVLLPVGWVGDCECGGGDPGGVRAMMQGSCSEELVD